MQVLSDNVMTVAYLNRLGGCSVQRNTLVSAIFALCKKHQVSISAKYLQGCRNTQADALSRQSSMYEWRLHRSVFNKLEKQWGHFTMDRFASFRTAQVSTFNSYFWEPHSTGVNALAQPDWPDHFNYMNSPFFLIPRVLDKIQDTQAEAVVLVPRWLGQVWFQKVVHMAVDTPMDLQPEFCVVPCSQALPEPWKNPHWVLQAWRVSGKKS